jgi:phage baseplate assembly protein W
MQGMSAKTGKALSGIEHLKQSIVDILTTPLGSRVMRRDYGSRLFQLIDSPTNEDGVADIIAATAEALKRWEPRFSVKKITVVSASVGCVILSLTGDYKPDGKSITLEGIEVT